MSTLTWWKCDYNNCDTLNHPKWVNCHKCFKTATKLPPLDQIMYEQKLLFDGFIRMKIISTINITDKLGISKLMTIDVINLCNKYYISNIETMLHEVPENMNPNDREWYDHEANKQDKEIYKIDFISYQSFAEHHNYFIAYKLYSLLIQTDPTDPEFHHSLAAVAEKWNLKDTAMAEYKLAIELDTDNNRYRYNYGLYLQSQEKYSLSLDQFIKAAETDPDNAEYAMELGYTYGALIENDKAKEYFQRAIEMEPDSAWFHGEFAYFLSENMADLDAAKVHFEKAIELDDEYASVYFDYARMMRDYVRDYNKAEEYYLKAVEINPHSHAINGSYGYLLHLMGRKEEAREYMEVQRNLDDKKQNKNNWTWFYYGLVCRATDESIGDESLLKALEDTSSKLECEKVVFRLSRIKSGDIENIDYYEKFEKMVVAKLNEFS